MKKYVILFTVIVFLFCSACANENIEDNKKGTEGYSSEDFNMTALTTNSKNIDVITATQPTTTETTTEIQSSVVFDENFLEAAYALVSKKHTVNKEDFMKKAEFISGAFYPSAEFYQIRYNNQVMGYIDVDFQDDYFYYSFSTRDDYASPASPARLIDGVWYFDESVTLG